VTESVDRNGYHLELHVSPNKAAAPNTFSLQIRKNGKPVSHATVIAGFSMLDMEMGTQSYTLPEHGPGLYGRSSPALVMVGHWGLSFEITPPGQQPFTIVFVDRTTG
jgi:copper transport protein